MKSVILINYCNVEYKAVYCGGKYITPCMYRKEEIYVCIVSVWNAMIEVTVDLLEKPCALPPYSCKQSFFFHFFFGYFNQLADYGGNGLTSWVKLWETL